MSKVDSILGTVSEGKLDKKAVLGNFKPFVVGDTFVADNGSTFKIESVEFRFSLGKELDVRFQVSWHDVETNKNGKSTIGPGDFKNYFT